jgi:hypothetical protein
MFNLTRKNKNSLFKSSMEIFMTPPPAFNHTLKVATQHNDPTTSLAARSAIFSNSGWFVESSWDLLRGLEVSEDLSPDQHPNHSPHHAF